jgi:hypothetical protein
VAGSGRIAQKNDFSDSLKLWKAPWGGGRMGRGGGGYWTRCINNSGCGILLSVHVDCNDMSVVNIYIIVITCHYVEILTG